MAQHWNVVLRRTAYLRWVGGSGTFPPGHRSHIVLHILQVTIDYKKKFSRFSRDSLCWRTGIRGVRRLQEANSRSKLDTVTYPERGQQNRHEEGVLFKTLKWLLNKAQPQARLRQAQLSAWQHVNNDNDNALKSSMFNVYHVHHFILIIMLISKCLSPMSVWKQTQCHPQSHTVRAKE